MTYLADYYCDVLIIGNGAAGLSLALRLAPYYQVIVLSKSQINESCTFYAQGGIAAVFDESDSIESHIEDTIITGAGLCDVNIVKFIVTNARKCVQWLINQGVSFDQESHDATNGIIRYHLNREGGHRYRRILHNGDYTGRVIETTLIHQAIKHHNIHIFEHTNAIDLIISDKLGILGKRRALGAWIINNNCKKIKTCFARAVVLATGGAAKVYQYTTNPNVISGDGIAMAWRAGCRVANLEFNQFHPTCFYYPQAQTFLLTEALRGEGAWLLRPDNTRFMPDFDHRAELAPRDIVTRSIYYEMQRLGVNHMYLDISHQSKNLICKYFPTIYKKLLTFNLDLTKQPIPIVPAAHYTCGGVIVDLHGKTDVDNLYAIGEVSYTGLHGANRMASNSLLECLVYSWSASEDIINNLPNFTKIKSLPDWNNVQDINKEELTIINNNMHELQSLMWKCMGIIRTTKQLEHAINRILFLQQEIGKDYINFHFSKNLLELRNILLVAKLMVQCALKRQESRGLHYILDFPKLSKIAIPTILVP
ncbi:L-aspartate oxidase [Pantoea sp. Mhis]|uniref:L-aspartate oxidase n=1 Tax=Pantoea sp. Mhis TaxID=2576759 RepID=UPI0013580BBB|nr:L-aspartate oxidase [Pantoea sp. Mhis]MXP56612.1 L-aspartate oxidase [Pantoea sp. Mhis]